jgi:hypothetical protein
VPSAMHSEPYKIAPVCSIKVVFNGSVNGNKSVSPISLNAAYTYGGLTGIGTCKIGSEFLLRMSRKLLRCPHTSADFGPKVTKTAHTTKSGDP